MRGCPLFYYNSRHYFQYASPGMKPSWLPSVIWMACSWETSRCARVSCVCDDVIAHLAWCYEELMSFVIFLPESRCAEIVHLSAIHTVRRSRDDALLAPINDLCRLVPTCPRAWVCACVPRGGGAESEPGDSRRLAGGSGGVLVNFVLCASFCVLLCLPSLLPSMSRRKPLC